MRFSEDGTPRLQYVCVRRDVLVAASCRAGLTKPFGERVVVDLELSNLQTYYTNTRARVKSLFTRLKSGTERKEIKLN